MRKKDATGWGWPLQSKKAHFFTPNGISMCGRWFFIGMDLEGDFPSGKRGPDDCATCWKRRAKALAALNAKPAEDKG